MKKFELFKKVMKWAVPVVFFVVACWPGWFFLAGIMFIACVVEILGDKFLVK